MGRGIRLGRVAGIEVHASWTLIVIAGLIAWTLGRVVLPGAAPAAPPAAAWAVAAVGTVAFLACLLAHELAHSLVARARGMRIEGITLWMFGGVSRLGGEPPDARSERQMALAGPATSAAIGVTAAALAVLLTAAHAPPVVTAGAAWLAMVNIVLAVFNLLPAFPLDGGRVLRSLIWARTGDVRRATAVAAAWGVGAGYGLLAFGLVLALAGVGISGVWMALLGWIVLGAARGEQATAELERLLDGTRVADVMTPEVVAVPGHASVDAVVRDYVAFYRCSAFPVIGADGTLAGLVTLARLRDVPADRRAVTTVAEVATPLDRVVTARPDEPLIDLMRRLAARSGRCALVVDDGGQLAGIVTGSDVERALDVAGVGGAGALSGGPGGNTP